MKSNNTKTMKNTVDLNEKSRKQKNKRKRAEANARRKVAQNWDKISHSTRYKKCAVRELCRSTTLQMEEELFDGILLNLKGGKACSMSYNRQKRILRRVVEKRQAQQVHHKVGRSFDRFSCHMQRHCTSKSMNTIKRYQMCA